MEEESRKEREKVIQFEKKAARIAANQRATLEAMANENKGKTGTNNRSKYRI